MTNSLDHSAGTSFRISGKEYLYFGGTSYLGLQHHPEFLETLKNNIDIYGSNFGASRKANVRLDVYNAFEDFLAKASGSEAAVCFSSGYLSGLILAIYFDAPHYRKLYAPNSHSALHSRKLINASTYQDLELEVQRVLAEDNVQPVIFLDTIDFSGKNYPHFEALQKLPLAQCILVADDSHGFGIVGDSGFQNYENLLKLIPKELIVCGSIGKALATPCGIVLGMHSRISEIKATEMFGGASPAAPAALKTYLDSQLLVKDQRKRLQKNISLFNEKITSVFKCVVLKEHPVYTYDDPALTAFLNEHGVITTSFHYPNEDSPLISKIVLSAGHSVNEILQLTSLINKFYA